MNRKRFTSIFLFTFVFLLFNGCGREPDKPNVDFTIDLNDPQYSTLYNLGGYVYINGIIVIRTVSGNYVALSEYCTSDGSALQYMVSQNEIVCPSDGSKFDTAGAVIFGPAQTPLIQYQTQLIGSSLRIYTL